MGIPSDQICLIQYRKRSSVNLRPKGVNHEQLFVKIKGQEAYDMYGPYVRELLEESGLKQTANGRFC